MAKNSDEKKKGSKAVPAACGAALIAALLFGGKQLGLIPFGDNGNSNDTSDSSSSVSEAVQEETSASTTQEVSTEPETDEIQYIEVTVSGNSYIYQNSSLSLDELMNEIKDKDMTVKLTDDKASKSAYDELVQSLDDNNIQHIE